MSKKRQENIYCNDSFRLSMFPTREVKVANVILGGNNPLRVQSMTNTSTKDIPGSIEQCRKIAAEGADIIRLTTIDVKEARSLIDIKKGLAEMNIDIPLVADVHFNPRVAYEAASVADKVRINPGNFIKSAAESTDARQAIREMLIPLLELCRENNTAIRIGVNHGSLSQRMLEKYGDTPKGMVESALEYMDICIEQNFHELVFSLKSSNTIVMIQANRLLVHEFLKRGLSYPIHLGVTEAGEGEDGRIKSAVGIGSLLADGIGDTLRVSLTEDPEREIPVGKKLASYFQKQGVGIELKEKPVFPVNPFDYKKRQTRDLNFIGGDNKPVVIAESATGGEQPADFLYLANEPYRLRLPGGCSGIVDSASWTRELDNENIFPLFSPADYKSSSARSGKINFLLWNTADNNFDELYKVINDNKLALILEGDNRNSFYEQRYVLSQLILKGNNVPVILKRSFPANNAEELSLISSAELGGLLIDGLGDGIWLDSKGLITPGQQLSLSFGILQAARVRTTKTEYISCPSCGRTLFNIQEVAAKIREKTIHLKGLKIAIMGCIVNGPGEMADADYGYVGSGPGKITLYRNKEVIKKNIPAGIAVEELVKLIKEYGDWKKD